MAEDTSCVLIDRDAVVKEVDDLVSTQKDACDKRTAYQLALAEKVRIEAGGKAGLDALVAEVDAANEAAALALSIAETATLLADQRLDLQMAYLCDTIKSLPGTDPTP